MIFLSFVGGNLGWGMDMWIVGSYCLLHGWSEDATMGVHDY